MPGELVEDCEDDLSVPLEDDSFSIEAISTSPSTSLFDEEDAVESNLSLLISDENITELSLIDESSSELSLLEIDQLSLMEIDQLPPSPNSPSQEDDLESLLVDENCPTQIQSDLNSSVSEEFDTTDSTESVHLDE